MNVPTTKAILALATFAAVTASALSCAFAQGNIDQQSQSAAQAIAIAGGAGTGAAAGRTQRVVTVPGVIPPSFYGANPCSNSASGGGAGMGFGISIGGQWTEEECRTQEWYRILNMGGQARLAQAYVCDRNANIRRVAREIGEPCPQDRVPQAVTLAPLPSPVQQASVQPARVRPDWCETASPSERRARAECR